MRLFPPHIQLFDSSGATAGSGKLYFYAQGTTTLQATYSDAALSTANTNPVIVNGSGLSAPIFPQYLNYTVLAYDSDDNLLWSRDYDARWLADGSDYTHSGTGAVARTVQDRLEDWVSVSDFGTNTTPGTTDMTTAWQAALDASDYVYTTEDTLVTNQLNVSSTTLIEGRGAKPKVLFSGTMAADNLFDCSTNSDISFRNLWLKGDQTADANSTILGIGIYANTGSRIYIEDCRVETFPQSAILLREVTDLRVVNCDVDDVQPNTNAPGSVAGINIQDDSTMGLIQGNRVSNIGLAAGGIGQGIRIIAQNSGNSAPTKMRIIGNHVENIQQHGILYYDQQTTGTDTLGSVIMGNTIEQTGLSALSSNELGNGIYTVSVSNLSITGNSINAPQVNTTGTTVLRGGIAINADSGDTSAGVTITGNSIKDSGEHGIVLADVDCVTVVGNTIDSQTNVAIRTTNVTNVAVYGNAFLNNNTTEVFEATGTGSNTYVDVRAAPDRSTHQEPFITNTVDGVYVTTTGTALPNAGTWSKGDIVFRREPAAGESIGWVCTVSGNAGTWVPFGGVQSASAYTRTATVVESRTLAASASATATNNNNVLAALIADLQGQGLIP